MSYKIFNNSITFNPVNQDAFNRLRVSDSFTQFEGMNMYGGVDPQQYFPTTANGGTIQYLTNEASWNLAVTTAAGSLARMESREYFEYHPGKSQLILMTGVAGEGQANTVKRTGYFDNNDGIFFIQNQALGFGCCIRSSTTGTPVDTIVYSSDWNVDKLDGTGKSGITLDPTKAQIIVMDFQWLGVGTVRFGFEIDGNLYVCHMIHNANRLDKVYMKSAWLPLRYEIENIGVAAAPSKLKMICSTVISEGGNELQGRLYTTPNSVPITVASGQWTPLISVKANTTLNGYQYRGKFNIQSLEIYVDGNQPMAFALFETANIATPTWVKLSANSGLEFDTTAATMNVISGGTRRLSGFAGASQSQSLTVVPPDLLVGYANTTFTLAALGLSGSSTTRASINLRESL